MVTRYDLIVIGAGPAGLSAAIEAAKHGIKPIVFDENAKPGGQLFKQIRQWLGIEKHRVNRHSNRSAERSFIEYKQQCGTNTVII